MQQRRPPLSMALLVCVALFAPLRGAAFDPAAGDFSRREPTDVRLLAYNTFRRVLVDPAATAAFERIVQAIDPDILVFEEMLRDEVTANELAAWLNETLPPAGGSWQVHVGQTSQSGGFICNMVASHWPLLDRRTDTSPPSSETFQRGVTIARVDLPDAIYEEDLYILGVHLKCCNSSPSDQAQRQRSADAIAHWLGDARHPGSAITLAANTPMIVMGDFNLVGGPNGNQPEQTLLTGDIQDEVTYGSDVKGDWDNSDLTDLQPRDPYTSDRDTWPSDTTNPTSRLDRFMYTDSVTQVPTSFILNVLTMTPAQRTAAGLLAGDTTESSSSDHLPIVMDIRPRLAQTFRTVWVLH